MDLSDFIKITSGPAVLVIGKRLIGAWRTRQRGEVSIRRAEMDLERSDKALLWERVIKLEGRIEALEHERNGLIEKCAQKDIEIAGLKQQLREKDDAIEALDAATQEQERVIERLKSERARCSTASQ